MLNDKEYKIKIMKQIIQFVLLVALVFVTSCNDDEPKFSSAEIQNAINDMKGTYYGKMDVSYYHGDRISEDKECKVVSNDSLMVYMDLEPMASTIADEAIAERLRKIGVVEVRAAYDFCQMDERMYHFLLLPKDVICLGGYGAPETVKIVFSQNFGGDADYFYHDIMFNLSPKELWYGDKKYEPFRQLVYHYEVSRE